MKHSRKKGFEDTFRLYKNDTADYNSDLDNSSFVNVMEYVCEAIARGGSEMGEISMNKALFFVLNLAPVFEKQGESYDGYLNNGITPHAIKSLKSKLAEDIAVLLNWIKKMPIMYDEPEAALAKLHFSGAFGKGVPDASSFDVECSDAFRNFDIEVYKRIRSAFTVEELREIESRVGKYSVLCILTGYYIDAYYKLIEKKMRRAGLQYLLPKFLTYSFIQEHYEYLLRSITMEDYKKYLDVDGCTTPSKAERLSLLSSEFCDSKIKKDVGNLLDEIRRDLKIGTKACSKKDFANIVFVFIKYLDCWKQRHFAPSRFRLAKYYGIPEPTYKIKDCKEYEKSEDGKILIRKLQEFNEAHKKKN